MLSWGKLPPCACVQYLNRRPCPLLGWLVTTIRVFKTLQSDPSCDVFITKAFHQKKELTFVNLSYESVFCNGNTVGKILM